MMHLVFLVAVSIIFACDMRTEELVNELTTSQTRPDFLMKVDDDSYVNVASVWRALEGQEERIENKSSSWLKRILLFFPNGI